MKNQNQKSQFKTLASKSVNNAYLDFLLSRQAMMCTENTLKFYEYSPKQIRLVGKTRHEVINPNVFTTRVGVCFV